MNEWKKKKEDEKGISEGNKLRKTERERESRKHIMKN
jgi:hypothetical protein